jgi:sulfatase maturation enzyme AslB (radical SAM superfamily)
MKDQEKSELSSTIETLQPASVLLRKLLKPLLTGHSPVKPLFRKFRVRSLVKVPPEVNIETISICNARCTMCPVDKLTRPKKAMDMHLFKKIVDECLAAGVKSIKLHNYGEPLLTPNFDRMLEYIRRRSQRIDIQFATNGSLLNDRWPRLLIQAQVNRIMVTIDGARKETYERIRRGLRYEQVTANVSNLLALKREMGSKYPEVVVEIIESKETRNEIDAFIQQWQGIADKLAVTSYSTRAGALSGNEFTAKSRPCFRLWKQMVITSTGQVAACCTDWDCKLVLGDLRTQTLLEVWRGPAVNELRRLHLQGRMAEIPLCSKCNPASWDGMPEWWYSAIRI